MNVTDHEEKNDNTILWLGFGLILGMGICFFTAALTVAILLSAQAESAPVSQVTPQVTASPHATDIAEETLSQLSSIEVQVADLPEIAERLLGLEDAPDTAANKPQDRSLGERERFWVTDVVTNESRRVEAELVLTTDLVYFWIGDGITYDLDDVRQLVENFERSTYPEVRSLIGGEWSPGVDGDPHLYILYVRGIGSSVAGLFFAKDEYSSVVHKYSNEHEMFYLNADTVDLGEGFAASLLAHEFQHLVHWNLDANEDTWMNEGLSELTEHVLELGGNGFEYLFTHDTDVPLLFWPSEAGSSGTHYGQSFLLFTYLYDRFGPQVIHRIAQNPSNGLRSIDEVLAENSGSGKPITIEDLILDWGISLFLQDPDLHEGQYGMRSYPGAPQAQLSEQVNRCPLEGQEYTVSQFGFDFVRINCLGEYSLQFSGETSTGVLSSGPHSGDYAFWSNIGDSSDMYLTRAFDFRAVSEPIFFDYWTWYQIEQDYDYLYLEVSTDDGETWQILTTPSGTGDDPSGNAYGWAYNGNSGSGNSPEWIRERVDLSAYAGEDVLLRFEYITDTAVYTQGFLLDDLQIEAIGYEEGFEEGDGGWIAEGFVRLQNLIPQGYKLAIIEVGEEVVIRKIDLDVNNQAKVQLKLDSRGKEVILIVTGTSRHSWLPAPYRIEITE